MGLFHLEIDVIDEFYLLFERPAPGRFEELLQKGILLTRCQPVVVRDGELVLGHLVIRFCSRAGGVGRRSS